MGTMNITYYQTIVGDNGGIHFAAPQQSLGGEDLVFSGEVQSAAFPEGCRFIRVRGDADAVYLVGDSPVIGGGFATRIGAGQIEYLGVKKGQKIAIKSP